MIIVILYHSHTSVKSCNYTWKVCVLMYGQLHSKSFLRSSFFLENIFELILDVEWFKGIIRQKAKLWSIVKYTLCIQHKITIIVRLARIWIHLPVTSWGYTYFIHYIRLTSNVLFQKRPIYCMRSRSLHLHVSLSVPIRSQLFIQRSLDVIEILT